MVLLHVLIALSSLAFATYLLVAPSAGKLPVHYFGIGLTVLSGLYLAIAKPAHLLETCTMGLLYLIFTSLATLRIRRELAAETLRIRRDR